MSLRFATSLMLAAALALGGCDDGLAPQAEPLQAFLSKADLPRSQPLTAIARVHSADVTIFRVNWGRPLDCTAGCFYSFGIGLRSGDRVGWLRMEDYGGQLAPARIRHFDFTPADPNAYSEEVLRELRAADHWTYHYAFLPALAADEDTPEAVLSRLSRELLLSVNLELALALIANPAVRGSVPVLEKLAELPDPYSRIRDEAGRLLRQHRAPA